MSGRIHLARLDADGAWQQVAYVGQWVYHDGREFQFTRETFESFIRNFEARGEELPFKYGHPSDSAQAAHMGAAGWITALEIRRDAQGREALYAKSEWTERARDMIKSRELRYASVEVVAGRDAETGADTGPELVGVAALVDLPFLKGMEPLAAQRYLMAKQMTEAQLLAEIVKDLGKDATMEKVAKIFAAKKALQDAYGSDDAADAAAADVAASAQPVKASDKPAEQKLEEAPPAEVALEEAVPTEEAADPVATIEAAAGMPLAEVAAKVAENPEAFAAFLSGEMPSEPVAEMSDVATVAMSKLNAQVKKLSAKESELSTKVLALEAEVRVEKAIAAGHVTEDQRGFLMTLGTESPKSFDKYLSDAAGSPAVPTTPAVTKSAPKTGSGPLVDVNDPVYKSLSRQYANTLKLKGDALHNAVAKELSARASRQVTG